LAFIPQISLMGGIGLFVYKLYVWSAKRKSFFLAFTSLVSSCRQNGTSSRRGFTDQGKTSPTFSVDARFAT